MRVGNSIFQKALAKSFSKWTAGGWLERAAVSAARNRAGEQRPRGPRAARAARRGSGRRTAADVRRALELTPQARRTYQGKP